MENKIRSANSHQNNQDNLIASIFSNYYMSDSSKKIYEFSLGMAFFLDRLVKIDGHGHSNISDGKYSIDKIIKFSNKFINSSIFLTDHNTLEHFPLVIKYLLEDPFAAKKNFIIPGIEFTCNYMGHRCHVILFNNDDDKITKSLITKQRKMYIVRECNRLKRIAGFSGKYYDMNEYMLFCGKRTPNWTLTYLFLQKHHPMVLAKKIMKMSRDTVLEAKWINSILELKEVYSYAQNNNSLIFLCHLGDLDNSLGKGVIADLLKEFPKLYFDVSKNRRHKAIPSTISKNGNITHQLYSRPVLVGTDFHDALPNPKLIDHNLKHCLLKNLTLNSIKNIDLPPIIFQIIFGTTRIISSVKLLRSALNKNDLKSLFKSYKRYSAVNQKFIETTIGFYISKRIIAESLLYDIMEPKDDMLIYQNISAIMTIFKRKSRLTGELSEQLPFVFAFGDILLRLGLYPLYSELISYYVTDIPTNLSIGYNQFICLCDVDLLINELNNDFRQLNRSQISEYSIIWRQKTKQSAFNTVLRTYLYPENVRNGITKAVARKSTNLLLNQRTGSDIECLNAYKNLVYDHIGATIIIEDEVDYIKLLSNLIYPRNWKLISAEEKPRQDYHHRLWLLFEYSGAKINFQFELMIKSRSDFVIGRAYQWKEKNCSLAISTSPWWKENFFDRQLALKNYCKYKSSNKMLFEEALRWKLENERNIKKR